MVEDLCRIILKVFHRALGLPLFSAQYLLRLIAELSLRHIRSYFRFRRFADRMSEVMKPLSGCNGTINWGVPVKNVTQVLVTE